MSIIDRARQFAIIAHGDQKRKYTFEPYWKHLEAVAATVEAYGGTPVMQAAAWLHDTLEDTTVKWQQIDIAFGNAVSRLVAVLTDGPYPRPGMNRAARKAHDRERLAEASGAVQTIKLADLMDNTKSIVQYDPDFARVYLEEKALLLEVLTRGNSRLLTQARWQLHVAQASL